MLLAHHITVDHTLSLLLLSASIAVAVADARARGRDNERSVQLQHAAYELGREVALARTPVSA